MYLKQTKRKARKAQLRAELVAGKLAAAKTPDARIAVEWDWTRSVVAGVPEEQRNEACALVSQTLAGLRRRLADGDFR